MTRRKRSGARRRGNPARPFRATMGRALSWESQVVQYPETGDPGIGYYGGETPRGTVDCLLFRHEDGTVVGILNYYAQDFPPWEEAGNVNVFVHPGHRRKGIATALVTEAQARWDIDITRQRFTESGAELANALVRRNERSEQ